MAVKAEELINILEKIAPPGLAEDWDNSGWQVGDPAVPVQKVMLALDVSARVVDEARDRGAQLIISHHPMFLKGAIKSVRQDRPSGALVYRLISAGIGVYAAHTTLDSAAGGVNDVLAAKLGLREIEVLHPVHYDRLLKLVVFVPAGHAQAVRAALGGAGAGWIGNYSDCAFYLKGTGTFRPRQGAKPFIGRPGELEQVEEVRIETVVKQAEVHRVIKAMLQAHPYEEVAYDLYPLENKVAPLGLGRVGWLEQKVPLAEFARQVKDRLPCSSLRFGGRPDTLVQRVAVCGGSGGDLWTVAGRKGAEVLVTGDVRYHAARDMLEAGMNFIDAGHFATEQIALSALRDTLSEALAGAGIDIEVIQSREEEEPWVSL